MARADRMALWSVHGALTCEVVDQDRLSLRAADVRRARVPGSARRDRRLRVSLLSGSGTGLPAPRARSTRPAPRRSLLRSVRAAECAAAAVRVQRPMGGEYRDDQHVRAVETTNGAMEFPEIGSDRLLRNPLHELSTWTVRSRGRHGDNYVLAYGDFGKGFVIGIASGCRLSLWRTFSARTAADWSAGAFLWFRTGSDVVVPRP